MNYVYIYFFNDIPRYVGKGVGDRWKVHRRDRKTQLSNKLRKVRTATGEWVIPLIIECQSDDEAKLKEIELIALYGREDLGTGSLWNLTDGGEGTRGHRVSEATKQKIRSAYKDPLFKAKHSAATSIGMGPKKERVIRPAKGSKECREKISQRTKEAMQRPDVQNKIVGRKLSKSHCLNISKSHQKFSDELIREVYFAEGLNKDISKKYGVSTSHVGCIKRLERDIYCRIVLGECNGTKIS